MAHFYKIMMTASLSMVVMHLNAAEVVFQDLENNPCPQKYTELRQAVEAAKQKLVKRHHHLVTSPCTNPQPAHHTPFLDELHQLASNILEISSPDTARFLLEVQGSDPAFRVRDALMLQQFLILFHGLAQTPEERSATASNLRHLLSINTDTVYQAKELLRKEAGDRSNAPPGITPKEWTQPLHAPGGNNSARFSDEQSDSDDDDRDVDW